MQDIFRNGNGEQSAVGIRESVVFGNMVGKLCGPSFFAGMGEVPGPKAIKLQRDIGSVWVNNKENSTIVKTTG